MTPAEKLAATKPPRKHKAGSTFKSRNIVWPWCRLRERRDKLRLSLADVAKAVKMATNTLWQIEHGTDPQLTTARKLADFFGATIEELWPRGGHDGKP